MSRTRLVIILLGFVVAGAALWLQFGHHHHHHHPAGTPAVTHGDLEIHTPWSRATAPGAPGVGYLQIVNRGGADDRLLAASADGIDVQIHTMVHENGVMKMRRVSNGLAVPAGGELSLAPGKEHLMLVDMPGVLVEGETIGITLQFERAGSVRLPFAIMATGTEDPHAAH